MLKDELFEPCMGAGVSGASRHAAVAEPSNTLLDPSDSLGCVFWHSVRGMATPGCDFLMSVSLVGFGRRTLKEERVAPQGCATRGPECPSLIQRLHG